MHVHHPQTYPSRCWPSPQQHRCCDRPQKSGHESRQLLPLLFAMNAPRRFNLGLDIYQSELRLEDKGCDWTKQQSAHLVFIHNVCPLLWLYAGELQSHISINHGFAAFGRDISIKKLDNNTIIIENCDKMKCFPITCD